MPSFEETNQEDQNNPDLQYEPGKQTDLEESDVVVEKSGADTSTEVATLPKAEEKRTEVPEELKPAVLDASIPLPKPAALQKSNTPKEEDPDAAKKPNLRSRWKNSPGENGTEHQTFGAIDDIGEFKESLSGRQTGTPKKRARKTTDRPKRDNREQPDNNNAADENGEKKQRPPRNRNRNRNRKPRGDSAEGEKGNRRSNDRSSPDKKNAAPRKQARDNNKNRENRNNDRSPAKKAKVEEPKGLLGKIVKSIKSIFGGEPEAEPAKQENRNNNGPARKRARQGNGNRNQNCRQGGRNHNENQEGKDGAPARKRPNRRRRPNNRRRNNNNNNNKQQNRPDGAASNKPAES